MGSQTPILIRRQISGDEVPKSQVPNGSLLSSLLSILSNMLDVVNK